MRESPDAPGVVQLPSLYVDAAHLTRQPFTVQAVLGKLDMEGNFMPAVHLSLTPEFCRRLGALLLEAGAAQPSE
jgi:hypothetical protein